MYLLFLYAWKLIRIYFKCQIFLKESFEFTFSISHDQELMEERLSLSVVKGQTSYLFGPNFLIYILEGELKASKKQNPKVPSWKRDCQ